MIFNIIGLCIILVSVFHYRTGFIFLLIYKFVLVQNISLISIPGIPLLTLDNFLTIAMLGLYFLKRKKLRKSMNKFPFVIPFILLCMSWTLSSVFALAGFMSELTRLIKNITSDLLLVFVIWEQINTKDDFKAFFKGVTVIIFLSCIYGLAEYMMQSNPIVSYEATLISDADRLIDYSYATQNRGYRIQSFFGHPIGAGLNWGLYFSFVIMQSVKNKYRLPFYPLAMITAFLCIPCIILTKMRSPLVLLMIYSLLYIDIKKKKFLALSIAGVFGVLIISPLITENINVLLSIFSNKAQDVVSGSSLDMRIEQFQEAFQVVSISPILGLGEKYGSVLDSLVTRKLYGLESIWLMSVVMYGVFGVAANIILAYYSIIKVPLSKKQINVGILAAGYWVVATVTSTPGFHLFFYYLIYFYLLKEPTIQCQKKHNIYYKYMLRSRIPIVKREMPS